MKQTRLNIARPDIFRYFDALPEKIFRQKDIAMHLAGQRNFWRLAQSTTVQAFVRFLLDSKRLTQTVFPFPKPYKREVRYVWGDATVYEIMLTLKPDCYFSHYTAVAFHGLTEQIPKTTYLNVEQPSTGAANTNLTQNSIDVAMRRPVRVSHNVAETAEFRVCLISGKNTQNYGVVEEPVMGAGRPLGILRFTKLERTLIDIAVRPVYAGGVAEVLNAYRSAGDRASANVLSATLERLAFTYPYHQAIGFYMERAGYKGYQLDMLRRFPMPFDFYLTHGMQEMEYIRDWRLFVPKGL